ncbi:MAG: cation diffusion facilitator family transporter [Syntrophorhabdaceae bacterium]|nr:cation diffusion facilitator family transporter [Syntrophorhabdaceae bacterium]MDD4194939.1 cation diffusion facilitator family transporter [Syntrophorhabdaceae bacterium]HOC46546.1 cation diffusion facilitator family transporter [Syntrophorhabdaceae bacterium]
MSLTGEKRLAFTLVVTLTIMAGEVVGGYLSNSLALLSDAGHMVTDALAIMLGLIAAIISKKPSDRRATFGYDRVGHLAALINGLSLLVIAVLIFYESYERFLTPPVLNTPVMIAIASIGLAGNIAMVFIMGHSHDDLTLRSVWLHILGDTLSSVGVIVSGLIIYFTHWTYADPIASIFIGGIIIWGGIRLVRDTMSIFLNLTPRGFDVEKIAADIAHMPDVIDVHDVHLWPVAHNQVAFSAHILVDDKTLKEAEETKKNIEAMLKDAGVHHSTLQIECSCVDCDNSLFCAIKPGSADHDAHDHH